MQSAEIIIYTHNYLLLYGNAESLKPLDIGAVKKKENEQTTKEYIY